MDKSRPVSTPMVTGCKLSKEDNIYEVNETQYRSMIENLHYVVASLIFHMQLV